MSTESQWLYFGTIAKTHGLNGDMVLRPVFPDFTISKKLKSIQVELRSSRVPFVVSGHAGSNERMIIKLAEINSVQEALNLVGAKVFIQQHELPNKSGKVPYYFTLMGFDAIDIHLGLLGKVSGVESNPAHDLLCIQTAESELLVPLVQPFLMDVNLNLKQVLLNLPEGYLQAFQQNDTSDDAD
jgi:16S rRNA processing protein RimM